MPTQAAAEISVCSSRNSWPCVQKRMHAHFDVHIQMWKFAVLHIESQTGVLFCCLLVPSVPAQQHAMSQKKLNYFMFKLCFHLCIARDTVLCIWGFFFFFFRTSSSPIGRAKMSQHVDAGLCRVRACRCLDARQRTSKTHSV